VHEVLVRELGGGLRSQLAASLVFALTYAGLALGRVPGLRMIVVCGPRIDPESLPSHDGLELVTYVDRLSRHLAAITDIERVVPITYMNSAASLKSFTGRNGGIVCTSSNARKTYEWTRIVCSAAS